jgi:hypothetical protein
MIDETQPKPQIIEAFHDYAPPFDATKIVGRMLRDVPRQFLLALDSIVLTNVAALSRQERERKTRRRERRITLGEARGYYGQAWKGELARITILLDNFEKRFGRSWLRIGIVRDLDFSELLFHELGHHIHRMQRPEYEGARMWQTMEQETIERLPSKPLLVPHPFDSTTLFAFRSGKRNSREIPENPG